MGKYSSMMCACAWLIIRVLGVWLGTEMIISECIVVRYRNDYLSHTVIPQFCKPGIIIIMVIIIIVGKVIKLLCNVVRTRD